MARLKSRSDFHRKGGDVLAWDFYLENRPKRLWKCLASQSITAAVARSPETPRADLRVRILETSCADLRVRLSQQAFPKLRRNTHVTPFRRGPREPCVTLCVRLSQQAVPKLRRNTHVTPFRRGLSGKCTWESIGHLIRGLSPWVSEAASSEAPVLSSSLLVCQLPAQSYSTVFKMCFLLKFHCFAVLYWFQLYSIVIPFFYR